MCGNYILISLVSSFLFLFSSFLLTLSGTLSEHKCPSPGLLFFLSFCFLVEMTQDLLLLLLICSLQSGVYAKAGGFEGL